MEIRISNCVWQTASVCPRYAFALVCASYFFKGMRLMAVAVAAKIDKNSLIPNKWAAETRCRVCNGILQRSTVPTGARVHCNLITYPDSPHFPITGGGKAACAQTVRCHCGIYNVFGWRKEAAYTGVVGARPCTARERVGGFVFGFVSFWGHSRLREEGTARTGFFSSFICIFDLLDVYFFPFNSTQTFTRPS